MFGGRGLMANSGKRKFGPPSRGGRGRACLIPLLLLSLLLLLWYGSVFKFLTNMKQQQQGAFANGGGGAASAAATAAAATAAAATAAAAAAAAAAQAGGGGFGGLDHHGGGGGGAAAYDADGTVAAPQQILAAERPYDPSESKDVEAAAHEYYEALHVLDVFAGPEDNGAPIRQLARGSRIRPWGPVVGPSALPANGWLRVGVTSYVRWRDSSGGGNEPLLLKRVRGAAWSLPAPLKDRASDKLLKAYWSERSGVKPSGRTMQEAARALPKTHPAYAAAKQGGRSGKGADPDSPEMTKYDFNKAMSAHLGARRANPPDLRPDECHAQHDRIDPVGLLPCTVVICLVNEEWWALIRTLHSILEGSPAELVEEIILVDDGSDADAPWLGKQLDDYIATLPNVKVIRFEKRSGLVAARMAGARAAKSPALVFLDSHIEVNEGWLPPLLERISDDPTVVASPVVAVIDKSTLDIAGVSNYNVPYGMFAWDMNFRWSYMRSEPAPWQAPNPKTGAGIKSPTFAGGLFAAHRDYFFKLGGYDEGMNGWGGENIEMALRLWQCGGGIEIIPCSIVSHIFRDKNPTKFPGTTAVDVTEHNLVRAAEVWLDEFKERFYESKPWLRTKARTNDVSKWRAYREEMGCRPFSWYLDALHPSDFLMSRGQALRRGWFYAKQPGKPPPPPCLGMAAKGNWIIDGELRNPCAHGHESVFILTEAGSIEGTTQPQSFPFLTLCLTAGVADGSGTHRVNAQPCKLARAEADGRVPLQADDDQRFDPDQSPRLPQLLTASQRWQVNAETMHVTSIATGDCLKWDTERRQLVTHACDAGGGANGGMAVIEFHGDGRWEEPHMYMQRMHGYVGSEPPKNEPVRKPLWLPKDAAAAAAAGGTTSKSDTTPLDRPVVDWRSGACRRRWDHLATHWPGLPPASIVVVFKDEAQSTLYRTIHSILNRSPPDLVAEVLLVDDGSTAGYLGKELDDYVGKPSFLGKVRVVRHDGSKGAGGAGAGARQHGVEQAKGKVVVLCEPHVEVQPGWLPPLLTRLNEEPSHIVAPHVDTLEPKTLDLVPGGAGTLGFMWNLQEHGIPPQPTDLAARAKGGAGRPTDPIRSPVLSSAVLAFDRAAFLKRGGFDPGMAAGAGPGASTGGVEHIELALRTWMCGGAMELVPCSRVGHIFQQPQPQRQGAGGRTAAQLVLRNKLRTALVWVDEPYRRAMLQQLGFAEAAEGVTPPAALELAGDVGSRHELRQTTLQCPHNFQWYLDAVFPTNALSLARDPSAQGLLQHVATGLCAFVVDLGWGKYHQQIRLDKCASAGSDAMAGAQRFLYTRRQDLRPEAVVDKCLHADIAKVRMKR
eukprot:g2739.t1